MPRWQTIYKKLDRATSEEIEIALEKFNAEMARDRDYMDFLYYIIMCVDMEELDMWTDFYLQTLHDKKFEVAHRIDSWKIERKFKKALDRAKAWERKVWAKRQKEMEQNV